MFTRTLPPHLNELAKKEINENSSQVSQQIQEIRKWLEKQSHLVVNNQENQWILTFLRCCKYDLEETKRRIDLYFLTKSVTPEFFDNKDPLRSDIQVIINKGACIPIKCKNGPTKILIMWRKVDANVITFNNMFKYGLMIYDILLDEDDDFVLSGQEILHDMKDFPNDMIQQMTPVICKKSMFAIFNAYPSRIKEIAFFNVSPMYELFTKLFEPFLSHDVKNKVTIHKGGLDDVYKGAPLTDFPKEYGGESGEMEHMIAQWKIRFEAYRERFLADAHYRSDEAKRRGIPKTSADVYGIGESFTELVID